MASSLVILWLIIHYEGNPKLIWISKETIPVIKYLKLVMFDKMNNLKIIHILTGKLKSIIKCSLS